MLRGQSGTPPQRPNRNWHTRIDNKKSEVSPSDTPQPLDTLRLEPSITNQIADAGSPIGPTKSRVNTTDSTSIQKPIGQDVMTHDSRIREPCEYNTHFHQSSNTHFRLYNSHTDNDDSSDDHLANNDHFLYAPENSERIDSNPDFSIVSHLKKTLNYLPAAGIVRDIITVCISPFLLMLGYA